MVLWELTLATAYFLGLKRTYRLALRIQRRVVPSRIRGFTQRRTRFVFDTVVKVQNKIAGTRLGSWFMRKKNTAAAQIEKIPSKVETPPTLAPLPRLFSPPVNFKSNWRPLNKDSQKSERLYSALPSTLAYERSRLKNSLIRDDIAVYANLHNGNPRNIDVTTI